MKIKIKKILNHLKEIIHLDQKILKNNYLKTIVTNLMNNTLKWKWIKLLNNNNKLQKKQKISNKLQKKQKISNKRKEKRKKLRKKGREKRKNL